MYRCSGSTATAASRSTTGSRPRAARTVTATCGAPCTTNAAWTASALVLKTLKAGVVIGNYLFIGANYYYRTYSNALNGTKSP